MKKIIAILLCMTIILGSFNHQISAKDYREDDFTLYENYDQYADEMSKIENYVTIENGKYALKLTKEAEKLFSRDSINYAQNHINALNYVIKRNSVSDVSVDQGFIVKISDKKLAEAYKSLGVKDSNIEGNNYVSLKSKPVNSINTIYTINSDNIITSGGITKVVFKWDGIEIWLSSVATRMICIGGAGAVIALFGLALGFGRFISANGL